MIERPPSKLNSIAGEKRKILIKDSLSGKGKRRLSAWVGDRMN